ncbi:MAG: hypothetical protein JO356_07720 [Acidobacteria bacterium]|nr:hypothetical protein [Acidobacteriota bacterium]
MACSICQNLEHDYQVCVREINSILQRRFRSGGEKLRELFRWQDRRDRAVQALYAHRKTHDISPQDRLKTA